MQQYWHCRVDWRIHHQSKPVLKLQRKYHPTPTTWSPRTPSPPHPSALPHMSSPGYFIVKLFNVVAAQVEKDFDSTSLLFFFSLLFWPLFLLLCLCQLYIQIWDKILPPRHLLHLLWVFVSLWHLTYDLRCLILSFLHSRSFEVITNKAIQYLVVILMNKVSKFNQVILSVH